MQAAPRETDDDLLDQAIEWNAEVEGNERVPSHDMVRGSPALIIAIQIQIKFKLPIQM